MTNPNKPIGHHWKKNIQAVVDDKNKTNAGVIVAKGEWWMGR